MNLYWVAGISLLFVVVVIYNPPWTSPMRFLGVSAAFGVAVLGLLIWAGNLGSDEYTNALNNAKTVTVPWEKYVALTQSVNEDPFFQRLYMDRDSENEWKDAARDAVNAALKAGDVRAIHYICLDNLYVSGMDDWHQTYCPILTVTRLTRLLNAAKVDAFNQDHAAPTRHTMVRLLHKYHAKYRSDRWPLWEFPSVRARDEFIHDFAPGKLAFDGDVD